MTYSNKQRAAFTLVELLVVIALIMILAGLGVAFLPTIGESARVSNGASALQQMILTAKQKALRDQMPCGIRLLPSADPNTGIISNIYVRGCQFLEKPEDFTIAPSSIVGTLYIPNPAINPAQPLQWVAIDKLDLSSVGAGTAQIGQNDFLELFGGGLMHRINAAPTFNALANRTEIHLSSAVPAYFTATKNYRIVRAARVTADDVIQLPESVIIDLATNAAFGNTLPTANADGSIDILFSPTGEVISSGTTQDTINLWVRDGSTNPGTGAFLYPAGAANGEQTILAIYVRSGLTAPHPPAPGPDPYLFIKDGRTSGK